MKFLKIWYIPILLILCLVYFSIANSCENKKREKAKQEEISAFKKHFTDSVQLSENSKKIAYNDSVQAEKVKTVSDSKAKVIKFKNEAEKAEHRADSLEALVNPKDTTCLKALAGKDVQLSIKDSTINELDKEAKEYSNMYYTEHSTRLLFENSNSILKTDIDFANRNIEKLQKQNKRNFFERNGLWMGLAAGTIGTLLIVR